ncbi:MAG: hypothetical protein AAFV47_11045 [Pseudomonadota bacterium]
MDRKEAFLAMYSFLEAEYELTKSDDLGGLLGSMSLLADGSTADPAIWSEWENACDRVSRRVVDGALRSNR